MRVNYKTANVLPNLVSVYMGYYTSCERGHN